SWSTSTMRDSPRRALPDLGFRAALVTRGTLRAIGRRRQGADHRTLTKDGATGVDRVTAEEYAAKLEDNLQSLLDRAKSGTYRAPPVRRVHIPKGNGAETRPIGIPTFEDKVLQRAVAMVLEAVYEQDFLACSYGFRPSPQLLVDPREVDGGAWKRRAILR